MYVQIIKKIFLADSSELMGVRLISASGAQKRFIPSLQTSCTSNSWEIFFFPIRANRCVLDSFSPPEPKNVWFLLYRHHVRRVHQKFFLADSSEVMGIRLISASWAQKSLIPILYKSCTSNSWKIIFSPIRANGWVLDSLRSPEPQNVWFLPSRHVVRRVHDKIPSRRFLLCDGYKTHFGLLSTKTFHSYFLDMMYVGFMKKFFLADSSELMGVRLISASWDQKRFIPTF